MRAPSAVAVQRNGHFFVTDMGSKAPWVCFLVVFVACLSACTLNVGSTEAPKAIQGTLALQDWDFATDGRLRLSGEWEFYWQRYVQAEDFSHQEALQPTGFLWVPGIWNGSTVAGQKIPGQGYATYRLRVMLGRPRGRLALKFLDMATAFSVYVNGQKLLTTGTLGQSRPTTTPRFFPQVVDFQSVTDHLDIVIQVANFHHRKGGAWEPIYLGSVDELRGMRERAVMLGIFLFGSILMMGLYHLGLFTMRPQEKAPLYFGVFCLLIALRILTTGERYLVYLVPDIPWEILTKLSYVSFYFGVPVFTLFFRAMFPERPITATRTIVFSTLPFTVLVLCTPARVYSHTAQVFEILTVAAFLYGMYVLIPAAYRKRESALVFLSGFVVLFVTTLNDVLYANLLLHTMYLSPYGLFTFIFLQAFLLSHRFSNAFAVVEDQRQALTQTNRAYAQEIIERQRIEAALRQSESALAEAQRIAQIGNWEWDLTSGALQWSDEVVRMFALPASCPPSYEVVRSLVHTNDREHWEHAVHNALEQDLPLRLDYRGQRSDGAICWIHSEARIVRNTAGHPVKLVGIFQDITLRKKMEEELLTASKLESIGVLAGGIAHDFNNILTAIIGHVSLAKREVEPSGKLYQRLDEVERAGARAITLTQQLLTFSKGGAPVKRITAMAELITETASFALRGSNVRGDFSFPAALWPAEVDAGQVTRVIHNLILNGVQAMPEGGIIAIGAENVTLGTTAVLPLKPGRYLKLSVQDHGSGIAEEYLSRIFDPYFTTKPTGSGLGLATAYSIIKRHDGHIAVTSQSGVGTTFHVYVPAASTDHQPLPEGMARLHTGTGRVLVMDDEETIRTLVQQMLHHLGYEAEVVKEGTEALARYQEAQTAGDPFAVVILDLTIPGGMGGKETMRRLLAIDPEVKAIVSSGYSNDPVMSAYKEYGFSDVVGKPFNLEELSKAVDKAIKARRRPLRMARQERSV